MSTATRTYSNLHFYAITRHRDGGVTLTADVTITCAGTRRAYYIEGSVGADRSLLTYTAETDDGWYAEPYIVSIGHGARSCTCKGFQYRAACKHVDFTEKVLIPTVK